MKLTNSKKEKADTQLRGCQFFSSREKSSLSARKDSRNLLNKKKPDSKESSGSSFLYI